MHNTVRTGCTDTGCTDRCALARDVTETCVAASGPHAAAALSVFLWRASRRGDREVCDAAAKRRLPAVCGSGQQGFPVARESAPVRACGAEYV